MNPINARIEKNLSDLLKSHSLTIKTRTTSGAVSDHVTVNECGAEFVVGPEEVTVKHPQGGWMNVRDFTTEELRAL